jgi:acyl carrier protein
MTEAQELEAKIARLFAERLEVEVPSPDLDLFQAGVVDSLLFVKLLAALEAQFGFRLAFDELEIDDFRTLRHVARFVAAKRRPAEPGRARPRAEPSRRAAP